VVQTEQPAERGRREEEMEGESKIEGERKKIERKGG
jgi:hypothetical protein